VISSSTWAIWLGLIVASFGVLEGIALFNKKSGDTLSENTRKWIGLKENGFKRVAGASVFAGSILGLAAWFVVHILE
jgi:hypothetical protein